MGERYWLVTWLASADGAMWLQALLWLVAITAVVVGAGEIARRITRAEQREQETRRGQ